MADFETLRVSVDANIAPFKKKMAETKAAASESMKRVKETLNSAKAEVPESNSAGLAKAKEAIKQTAAAAVMANPKLAALQKVLSGAAAMGKKGFGLMATAASKSVSAIQKVSGVAASLINKFRSMAGAVSNFASRLLHMGRSADTSASKLNGLKRVLGSIAGLFVIRSIVNFGKDCLQLGSDLTEVQNVVDSVFVGMRGSVNEWAQSAATNFGLSETMAKRYAGTFGAMSRSFGFAEKDAYEMSTKLAGLSGDVASFYNITQDEAYTKMKSVFTGETESLKELGVVMTQNALDQFAMANGYGKTTKAMSEQEKVALRYAFVQKQLETASGDFLKTSNSWANQTRLLSLQFESLKATIGQGLINALTPVIQVINVIIGRIATVANSFKALTAMLFGNRGGSGGMASEVGDIADGYDNAAGAAGNLADATEKAGNAAEEAAKKALGLLGFDKINKLADDANSKSGSGSGAGASAGSPVDYGTLDEIEEEAGSLGNKLASIFDVFKTAWENKGQRVIESWKTAFGNIKELIGDVGTSLYNVWTDGTGQTYLENILELAGDLGDILGTFAKSISDAWKDNGTGEKYIKSLFDKWNSLMVVIDSIADSMTTVWGNGTGEKIIKNMLEIFTNINETVAGLADNFSKAWKSAGNGDAIIQGICDIVESISKYASNITKDFSKWAKDIDFEPLLKSVNSLLDALGKLTDTVGEKVQKFFEDTLLPMGKWTIEEGAPKAIEGLAKALDKLASGDYTGFGEQIGKAFGSMNKALKEFTGSDGFHDSAVKAAGDVADTLNGLFSEMDLGDLGEAVSNTIETALDSLSEFVSEFDWVAFGEQIGEFLGSIDWAELLIKVNLLILKALFAIGETGWGIVKGFGESVGQKIKETAEEKFGSIGEGIKEAKLNIKGKVDDTFTKAKEKWESIKEGVSEAIKTIKGDAGSKWDDIKKKWAELKDEDVFKKLGLTELPSWGGKLKEKWNEFKDNSIFKKIGVAKQKGSYNGWDGKVKGLWKAFKNGNVFKYIGLGKQDGSVNGWGSGKVRAAWDSFKNKDVFKNIGLKKSKTWAKIKKAWDAIHDKGAKIKLDFEATMGDIRGWLNRNVAYPINNKIRNSVLGDVFPSIKTWSGLAFANGAYLPKNTPTLAMVGDNKNYGEIVAPENKMQKMADEAAKNAGSDLDYDILARIIQAAVYAAMISVNKDTDNSPTVVIEGDMDKIFQVVVKKIREYTRIHGRTPFPV